jgi:hypothetical protein
VARTAFAAQNLVLVSLISAATGATTGWLVERNLAGFRPIFVLGAVCALASLIRLRSVRLRREGQLLASEQVADDRNRFDSGVYWSILKSDPLYRRYMICMMILGSGNLMFTAPLILIMTNHLLLPSFDQVLLAAALPTLVAPFATPFWARILSRHHVIYFRTRNSVFYAVGILLLTLGVGLPSLPCLYAGSLVLGIGIGGGALGWNLGHNDFASDARVAEYLGLHVSLTGIRGLLAPVAGVAVYSLLERIDPGFGRFALLLPLALTSSGVAGFWWLQRCLQQGAFPDQPAEKI